MKVISLSTSGASPQQIEGVDKFARLSARQVKRQVLKKPAAKTKAELSNQGLNPAAEAKQSTEQANKNFAQSISSALAGAGKGVIIGGLILGGIIIKRVFFKKKKRKR